MSENKILTQCFDREELTDRKRPETVSKKPQHLTIIPQGQSTGLKIVNVLYLTKCFYVRGGLTWQHIYMVLLHTNKKNEWVEPDGGLLI